MNSIWNGANSEILSITKVKFVYLLVPGLARRNSYLAGCSGFGRCVSGLAQSRLYDRRLETKS